MNATRKVRSLLFWDLKGVRNRCAHHANGFVFGDRLYSKFRAATRASNLNPKYRLWWRASLLHLLLGSLYSPWM